MYQIAENEFLKLWKKVGQWLLKVPFSKVYFLELQCTVMYM